MSGQGGIGRPILCITGYHADGGADQGFDAPLELGSGLRALRNKPNKRPTILLGGELQDVGDTDVPDRPR